LNETIKHRFVFITPVFLPNKYQFVKGTFANYPRGVVKNEGTCVLFPIVGGSQENLLMAFGNDPAALKGLESK